MKKLKLCSLKDPVNLEIFPADICLSAVDFAAAFTNRSALRAQLIFYITPLVARNTYARHVSNLHLMQAREVLDLLGGLGGVW